MIYLRRCAASDSSPAPSPAPYEDETRDAGGGLLIARGYELWWEAKRPEQSALWNSTVTLSKDFFEEIIERPVPNLEV